MRTPRPGRRLLTLAILAMLALPAQAWAQADPTVVDPNLAVRTVATGLSQPTGLAFIGANDMLVNEKATGRVIRIRNGIVEGPVLDLAVNSASERGLLGIALHRNFMVNGFVYLFWSESNTGADSNSLATVDLLANRLDRFVWNGSTLTFDRNLIRFRAF
jgi:glucose/arabinose dehydrogenase